MHLRVPVDVLILQVMSTGEHANPVRVRYLIESKHMDGLREEFGREEMWSLDYITQRMGELRGIELLERVPPGDSGLYQITDLGHCALRHALEEESAEFSYRDLVDRVGDGCDTEPVPADAIQWDELVQMNSD